MNLYYAPDSHYANGNTWTPQQVIAPNIKAAREIVPFGTHRRVELVRKNIDKKQPTVKLNIRKD